MLFLIALLSCSIATELRAADNLFGKSYALVIGIDGYRHSDWPALPYGTKDALAMGEFLESQGYEVTSLLGEEATRDNILWTMSEELAPKLTGRDRVMVFFSGHGETRDVGWRDYGYIIPYDGSERFTTWISMSDLREMSAQMLKARHQLFIFDSCYGGAIGQKARVRQTGVGARHIEKVSSNRARQFLTAGGKDEQVPAEGPHGYSYFTGYLLEALEGKADHDQDSYVTMSELSAYMLTAASTWGNTPRWGTLPEHAQGEFWFQVPGAEPRVSSLSTIGTTPAFQTFKGAEPGPQRLSYPQDHQGDDLRLIEEIGPKAEKALYDLGIYHYWQIASWTGTDLGWVKDHVPTGVKGKIKDCTIRQAQKLVGQVPEPLKDCDLDRLDSIAPIN